MKTKKYYPPEISIGDAAHTIARAGLGAILPGGGTAVSELLNTIITPPIEKRRNEWMHLIGESLLKLEESMGIMLETLKSNDRFIDAAIHASLIAIRTHKKEKLEYLRNSIVNSVLQNTQNIEWDLIFLNFGDSMTVWHVKILSYLNHSLSYWKERHAFLREGDPDYKEVAKLLYPELNKDTEMLEFILFDLSTHRLTTTGKVILRDASGSLLTETGKKFLEFISNPLENKVI